MGRQIIRVLEKKKKRHGKELGKRRR